jgi:PTS system nitrogen regulatory IIA component
MFPPQFIVAGRIGSNLEINSKKRLLEVLGELLATGESGLSAQNVFEHLLERERLGSTGLGHGVALPHARMAQVTDAVGAFVQLRKGVSFDSIDDRPVDLAFALLVPESANEMHLQLLSELASIFNDSRLRQGLREATSREQVLAILQNWGNDSHQRQ